MRSYPIKKIIFSLILLAFPIGLLLAKTLGPAQFQDNKTISGISLRLHGAGLKKFINFKVVAVGLYLPPGLNPSFALNDVPKHLEVIYLINIPKVELDRATDVGIKKNVTATEYELLRPKIDQINSYYKSVGHGDRIGISYVPQQGTIVSFNGQIKGIVKGADFARAFFAIWIGDNPVDPMIKKKLLGV